MKDNELISASHAVYALRLHLVFVTKISTKDLNASTPRSLARGVRRNSG